MNITTRTLFNHSHHKINLKKLELIRVVKILMIQPTQGTKMEIINLLQEFKDVILIKKKIINSKIQ